MKRPRQIGTTNDAIARAEDSLGRRLPEDFKAWLRANNGNGVGYVHIYPILDDRDRRKTWESIVHNYENGWKSWLSNFDEDENTFAHLLPFGDYGTGDYYCFDYSGDSGLSASIVHWSHETGETEYRADHFSDFCSRLLSGEVAD